MNATLKNLITNPFVIGGTAIGIGVTAGAVIYSKHRPKTDAEVELEKLKEKNAEAEREREHQREIERIKAKQSQDAINAEEETKRKAKAEEERTKQIELEIKKIRDEREWQKNAPEGYWRVEEAKYNANGAKAAAEKEADTQLQIARLQAETSRYSADANARAIKDREHYSYLRQQSSNNADTAKVQSMFDNLATIVTGKND